MDNIKNTKRLIIGFDGCDGSGKTTMINAFQKALDDEGIPNTIVNFIPYGPVRDILLSENEHPSPTEQLLLLGLAELKSREMIDRIGKDVEHVILLDRCQISRMVYQERYFQMKNEAKHLNNIIQSGVFLDVLIFVNPPIDTVLNQIASRGYDNSVFESGRVDFIKKTHGLYEEVVSEFSAKQNWLQESRQAFTKVIELGREDDLGLMVKMALYDIDDYLGEEPKRGTFTDYAPPLKGKPFYSGFSAIGSEVEEPVDQEEPEVHVVNPSDF